MSRIPEDPEMTAQIEDAKRAQSPGKRAARFTCTPAAWFGYNVTGYHGASSTALGWHWSRRTAERSGRRWLAKQRRKADRKAREWTVTDDPAT